MKRPHASGSLILVLLVGLISPGRAEPPLTISIPMSPPEWALLQRELLRANSATCEVFYARCFDERGWALCVER